MQYVAYVASHIEGELRITYLFPDNTTRTVTRDVTTGETTDETFGTAALDSNGNPTNTWFA